MKKIDTVGKFDIYELEQNEEVEKGCKYGLIERERAIRTNYLIPLDMDFYEKTKRSAIERAQAWS